MVSVGYQGYVFSGVYRKHSEDIIHFSEKLLQFNEMNHFVLGDLNFNCYSPQPYSNGELQCSHYINEIGFVALEKDSATFIGHRNSDIEHILVPQDCIDLCSSGSVMT